MIRSTLTLFTLLVGAMFSIPSASAGEGGSFAVQGEQFLLNGKPFRIMSGEMHYPRVPRAYWQDRFAKMKAMGLNTICTYIFWNAHEPRPGDFNFEGNLDVAEYIREAQKAGLYVIVRPGPYVCSEWDFGGLPSWLLSEPDIKVRCMDPRYMAAVKRYVERLGQELHGLQISEGGPIILVQLENEYGSYGNDKQYLRELRDILLKAGFTVPLYTSDGGAQYLLESGTLPDVTPVVNFGGGPEGEFGALTKFRGGIPQMCGEFWCGWFTHWSDSLWGRSDAKQQVKELEWMLTTGKSFNLYMFHGGTNFGFTAGSNHAKNFEPDVTSYDYDAPLDEAGRPTPKFFAFRDLLKKHGHGGRALPDLPPPMPLIEIPSITLTEHAALFASLPAPIHMPQPQPMEYFGQESGSVLYRTTLIGPRSGKLVITDIHDYASIYLNGKLIGRIDRSRGENSFEIPAGAGERATLDILVDAMGRVNFGDRLIDRKGITERVTLSGITLMNWDVFSLPMDDRFLAKLTYAAGDSVQAPAFFRGSFDLKATGDTYLDMKGWKKGLVWINGHNLGRFWDAGPQERLFVPGAWLTKGRNEITVFDLDRTHTATLRAVTTMK
jgi:beta-galactosidase